jgi:hypothetical protein
MRSCWSLRRGSQFATRAPLRATPTALDRIEVNRTSKPSRRRIADHTDGDLLHDREATTVLTPEPLAARERHTRYARTCGMKSGQSQRRPSGTLRLGVAPHEACKPADQAAAHQAAQICLDEVLATNHVLHRFLQFSDAVYPSLVESLLSGIGRWTYEISVFGPTMSDCRAARGSGCRCPFRRRSSSGRAFQAPLAGGSVGRARTSSRREQHATTLLPHACGGPHSNAANQNGLTQVLAHGIHPQRGTKI